MRSRLMTVLVLMVMFLGAAHPADAFLYSTRRVCYTSPSTFDHYLNNEVSQCSNSTVGRVIYWINDIWPDWFSW